MKYLVYLLIFIFPFGQLLRLPLKGSEIVLHANDVAVATAVLVWFTVNFWKGTLKLKSNPLFLPIALWIFAMIVSLAVNLPRLLPFEALASALYLFRWVIYAGLFFVILNFPEKKKLSRWLILMTLAIAGSGLVQYLISPDTTALAVEEWDNHYFRLIGTFLDPGFTGAILVFGLVLIFLTLRDQGDKIGLAVVYGAVALTYSRASYLMYLVAFAAVAYFRKSARVIVIATLVLALTLVVLPRTAGEGTKLSRENSFWARIHNWQQTLAVFKDHPIFGVGFDSYRYSQRDYGFLTERAVAQSHSGAGADSTLFLVLATTGIVGFLAYCNLLWGIWKINGTILLRVSLLAVLANSFFNNTLFYPWVMEWLWIIAALGQTSGKTTEST